jgi:hypothetical protein
MRFVSLEEVIESFSHMFGEHYQSFLADLFQVATSVAGVPFSVDLVDDIPECHVVQDADAVRVVLGEIQGFFHLHAEYPMAFC